MNRLPCFTVTMNTIFGFFVLALVLSLPEAAPDNILKHYDSKIRVQIAALDSIKDELARGRRKLADLAKQEGTFKEQLELLEKNMAVASGYLQALDIRIDTTESAVAVLRDSLKLSSAALSARQSKMEHRLRTMYKTGRMGIVQLMVSSAGITDMLNRMKYFQSLKNYDESLLRSIDSSRVRIAGQTAQLEAQLEQLTQMRSAKEAEQDALTAEREDHRLVLTKVSGERAAWEQMVRELEDAQKELAVLLQSLRQKRSRAKTDFDHGLTVAFEKRRGKLPWPADGAVVRPFGKIVHPVYHTVTMNTGVDIGAGKGTGVFCVASGRVAYVGWMRGYGKFVIVNHAGGYVTIYAHLDGIVVGVDQDVEYGTMLGRIGDSGTITDPRLHFQIRRETEPLDPMQWLEAR
jgi:septal ring factor EnvC (AmiA/AmiB activator)